MIGYVMVGSNDIDKSTYFYDSILFHLGLRKQEITEDYIGYAQNKKNTQIEFYLTKPFNGKVATYGNGTMIAFLAQSRGDVEKFHKTGLELGGIDEGKPGLRPTGGSMYLAYVRDFDGNKICAYCND